MITVHQTAEEGPDVIKIDKLVSKYQPVTFSHKVHAQMSEMSGGCANCHHYNISGPILPCSDCHSVERKREVSRICKQLITGNVLIAIKNGVILRTVLPVI